MTPPYTSLVSPSKDDGRGFATASIGSNLASTGWQIGESDKWDKWAPIFCWNLAVALLLQAARDASLSP